MDSHGCYTSGHFKKDFMFEAFCPMTSFTLRSTFKGNQVVFDDGDGADDDDDDNDDDNDDDDDDDFYYLDLVV